MDIKFLLQHHNWANQRYLNYIKELDEEQVFTQVPEIEKSVYDILFHIAEVIDYWIHIIEKLPTYIFDWEVDPTMEELEKRITELQRRIAHIVNSVDLSREIIIQWEQDDVPVSINPTVILFNYITHSAYHRGQLALLLRYFGFDGIEETDINPYYYNLQQKKDF